MCRTVATSSVGSNTIEIPPPEYVCDRCFIRFHYSKNCPTLSNADWPRKMREWNVSESCVFDYPSFKRAMVLQRIGYRRLPILIELSYIWVC